MAAALAVALALAATPAAEAARAAQDADRLFSRTAETRDIDAFAAMLAADTVFLSESGPPALGRAGVRAKWSVFFDPAGPSLTWEPIEAGGSDRGELAFTRGRFVFRGKDPAGKPVEERGQYLSIWRRDPDGVWRVVVDSSLPADIPGPTPSANAPSRVLGQGLSGDLRYLVRAVRLPAIAGTDPSGPPSERREVTVERRNVDGTWSKVIEAVTVGPAPQL